MYQRVKASLQKNNWRMKIYHKIYNNENVCHFEDRNFHDMFQMFNILLRFYFFFDISIVIFAVVHSKWL